MEKEHLPFIIIAGLAALVYSYSAPILSALELWGNMFWFVITLSIPLGFCLVVGAIGFKFWEAVTEVSHRRQIDFMKADAALYSAQKKTMVLEDGQRRQLSTLEKTNLLLPQPTPDLLDLIDGAQMLLLIGGSGSGKTELTKHIVNMHQHLNRDLRIVDPHSPSKILGINTIGAGMDFKQIEAEMLQIMVDINRKYQTGNISQDGDLGESNQYYIFDEMLKIRLELPDLYHDFMHMISIDARKAGYNVQLNVQSAVEILNGNTALLNDFSVAKLSKNFTTNKPNEIVKFGKFDSRKAELIDVKLPGLFRGYASVNQDIKTPRDYSRVERSLMRAFACESDRDTSQNELIELAKVGKGKAANDFARKLLNN